jgi:hypothetical protein
MICCVWVALFVVGASMVLLGPAPVINAVASIIKASRQSANLMADSLFEQEQRAEKERAFLF